MKVAIIRYNAGNIRSVDYALKRLGVEAVITADHDTIRGADRVIFPGVGEARTTMRHLRAEGLDKLIPELRQPVLGICLGLQLMCAHSEEGDTDCMNIFPIAVRRFQSSTKLVKVPHMGWNAVRKTRTALFDGVEDGSFTYFVHSYYAELSDYTAAETEYILPFSSALSKDNFMATQFHPEKSAQPGSRILENFLNRIPVD